MTVFKVLRYLIALIGAALVTLVFVTHSTYGAGGILGSGIACGLCLLVGLLFVAIAAGARKQAAAARWSRPASPAPRRSPLSSRPVSRSTTARDAGSS